MLRMCQLSHEQRRRALGNSAPKPDEETGGDKHAYIDTNRLENHAQDHQQATRHDPDPSTGVICDVRCNNQGDDPTDGHDRIKEAAGRGIRVIERYIGQVSHLSFWQIATYTSSIDPRPVDRSSSIHRSRSSRR